MTDWFCRVPSAFRPALEAGLALVPDRMKEIAPVRFCCGFDPGFIGLHHWTLEMLIESGEYEGATLGYDVYAHFSGVGHSSDRVPTIVLPSMYRDMVGAVLHEYGHALDEATGFRVDCPETTAYSRVNRGERIAEAIELILRPRTFAIERYTASDDFEEIRRLIGAPNRRVRWVT